MLGDIFLCHPGFNPGSLRIADKKMTTIKTYYVYIMTNFTNNVVYTGVTSDLIKRVYEHKEKLVDGFTKKYNLFKLVYYEEYNDINIAIAREKKLKRWRRGWKESLIEKQNPQWMDLYESLF